MEIGSFDETWRDVYSQFNARLTQTLSQSDLPESIRRQMEAYQEYEDSWQQWERHAESTRERRDEQSERQTHPGNRTVPGSGILDAWYLDDGAVLSHPRHMVPYFWAFDRKECATRGQ